MVRPRVLLNCAVSSDGFMAGPAGAAVLLSNQDDLKRVHRMRAACDAILVGAQTVRSDDPALKVKPEHATGDHPLRVVLSSDGNLPVAARVLDGSTPTLVITGPDAPPLMAVQQVRIPKAGETLDLSAALDALGALGIASLMVEGGATLLHSFLAAGAWDEFTVYVAPEALPDGTARLWSQPGELGLAWTEEPVGDGRLLRFSPA